MLSAAVDLGYFDRNPARGIKIGEREPRQERRLLTLEPIRVLLGGLSEPCRSIVFVAVLTGMRIGEILALRWKRLDSVRGTIEVAETFSDGAFGTPKTRSSRRVIPMSSAVRDLVESHRKRSPRTAPDDLVFCTSKGTPASSKNLYNRVLESLKTAQAILGHSDVETTLNTYVHAIPDSQRRALEKVAGVLCPNVPNFEGANAKSDCELRSW